MKNSRQEETCMQSFRGWRQCVSQLQLPDKLPQTGWLKQEFIFSLFWWLEVPDQNPWGEILVSTPSHRTEKVSSGISSFSCKGISPAVSQPQAFQPHLTLSTSSQALSQIQPRWGVRDSAYGFGGGVGHKHSVRVRGI